MNRILLEEKNSKTKELTSLASSFKKEESNRNNLDDSVEKLGHSLYTV
jgi:hypothetical protein